MMDRKYIDSEHIVDRYLSGELTVRKAREFEQYCREHPEFLKELPIPVRLKARLSRAPGEHTETGAFQAIPSSASHVAVEASDAGFDPDEEHADLRRNFAVRTPHRLVLFGLLFALIAAAGGVVAYAMQARALEAELAALRREMQTTQMQAPSSVQAYRLELSRTEPAQPTLALGWLVPPQLLDLRIATLEAKYNTFQLTIDKIDGGRVMVVRRIARDSNKELRLTLNSSALGPGDYMLKFEGYTWRGQTEPYGWIRLQLQ